MALFQKFAYAALASVLLLLFVGAIVRATGSGLGCPDWPTCWGSMIPPTSVEGVDFEKIDLEKFRRKAERHGRDPNSVTLESLRAEFNPTHTWVEYVNRLCSLPVGFFTLAIAILAFRGPKKPLGVRWGAVASLLLVLINAELGRRVVLSGLKPGIITLHMALAILLLCILVYVAWRGCDSPWRAPVSKRSLWWLGWGLFGLTVAEGVMGAQVRELTDELAKRGGDRAAWIAELESSAVYLIHRSFSWLIVVGAALFWIWLPRESRDWLVSLIVGVVGSLLVMGVVLAHIAVFPVVQVLHVGAAAILVTALFLWLLVTRPVTN